MRRRWISGRASWPLLLVVAAATAVLVYVAADGPLRLDLEHRLRSRLVRHAKVATLDLPAVPGLRMFLHPDDVVLTYRIMQWGLWEPVETQAVIDVLRRGDTFVDVGANIGYYTLIAARLVGESGRVFAFEPDPVAFAILEKNVRLNGLGNVTLEPKAVAAERGTLQLFLADVNKGDHRIYRAEDDRAAIDVEAVSLDEYFAGDGGRIDFVKIDTQGAEGVILDGMRRLLATQPTLAMAVEYWPRGLRDMGYEAAAILDLLQAHDFLLFNLGAGGRATGELQTIERPGLLRAFTVANGRFTNLLGVKGAAELRQLQMRVLAARQALERDSEEIAAARASWAESSRAALRAGAAPDAAMPEPVVAALRLAPEERGGAHERSLADYFRAHTPLLGDARRDLARARTAVEAFRARALAGHRPR